VALPIQEYSWHKFGLVYNTTMNPNWGESHALVPSPVVLSELKVRIYCSFIDSQFRGRIGFADIEVIKDTPQVVEVGKVPTLDLGESGSFSQYGVGLGTFWPNEVGGDLYFVGFDRPAGFKFKAFSGKAIYDEASMTYKHSSQGAVFGPECGGATIVGVHDIFQNGDSMHALVSIGSGFQIIDGKEFPKYQVHLASGKDLESLAISPQPIISAEYPVYRIGRPRIYQTSKGFEILVTAGDLAGNYLPRVFYSKDLQDWREGSCESFTRSTLLNFDDQHQCYLSRFSLSGDEYIVYNGNRMGINGFGIAKGTPLDA
jgi:hypothetical protein